MMANIHKIPVLVKSYWTVVFKDDISYEEALDLFEEGTYEDVYSTEDYEIMIDEEFYDEDGEPE